MSRTYKDAPYEIRAMRFLGHRPPKDWRERLQWRGNYSQALAFWNEYLDIPRGFRWGNEPSWFRRDLNAAYRAKVREEIANGRYDDIPRPRRNAKWLYW